MLNNSNLFGSRLFFLHCNKTQFLDDPLVLMFLSDEVGFYTGKDFLFMNAIWVVKLF